MPATGFPLRFLLAPAINGVAQRNYLCSPCHMVSSVLHYVMPYDSRRTSTLCTA